MAKVQRTMDEDAEAGLSMSYALIIDGKALLYALSPRLRQHFLSVGVAAMYDIDFSASRTTAASCCYCNLPLGTPDSVMFASCRLASGVQLCCAAEYHPCRRRRSQHL